MSSTDPRLLALLDEPVTRALREAARGATCHLVGGLVRDRLLGVASSDFDAVVATDGLQIGERLARHLPARLVHLGGKAFAAYRLVGHGFILDIWDRRQQSLRADLARRDLTVNAIALDLARRQVVDPFDGLGDLARRRLRATTPRVFADDPLRVLRLVRLSLQLTGFRADTVTLELARGSAGGLAGVAAERVRDELDKILRAPTFLAGFDLLAKLGLYPGMLLGRPGTAGDTGRTRRLLGPLEAAITYLGNLADLPHGRCEPSAPRLATLMAGVTAGDGSAATALEDYRRAGYLPRRQAARCSRLMTCREAPQSEAAARWFLHSWAVDWPAAIAMLAAFAEPPLAWADWRRLQGRLAELADRQAANIFAPPPLLDGDEVGRVLGIDPGPAIGAALERLRRAQVEGRVRDCAGAEAFLRGPASDAD